jgi:SAM-dependent methyltransferase
MTQLTARMSEVGLRAIIKNNRRVLTAPIQDDRYLSQIAAQWPSHRFLGNSTQAVYQRQVSFLSSVLTTHTRKSPSDITVLDWGCGKGHIAYLLRKSGFAVTACDAADSSDDSAFGQDTPIISEQKIEVVPLRDAVQLPFETGAFDCVTSFGVLEHVPRDLESLQEIRRVLKPRGLLYVTFLPYPLSWTQAVARLRGNDYHDRLYWRRRVFGLAASAGFAVQSVWLGQLFPKNSMPLSFDPVLERLDRALCRYTPLKYFATNLEAVLTVL